MSARTEPDQSTVEICRCGNTATAGLGPDTYWYAPNDLFNLVNGSPNGFMCPACFTTAAAKVGIPVGWRSDLVGTLEDVDRLRAENEALRSEKAQALELAQIDDAFWTQDHSRALNALLGADEEGGPS